MRTMKTLLILLVGLGLGGCTHVRPWERTKLAHPTMAEDFGGVAEAHVRAVQEGAAGGGAGGESGCGCN
jgi:hypothetical protein